MCLYNITFIHFFRSVGVEVDKTNLDIVIEKMAGKSLEELMATGNSKLADRSLVDLMATVHYKLADKLTEEHMVSDSSNMDNKSLEELMVAIVVNRIVVVVAIPQKCLPCCRCAADTAP